MDLQNNVDLESLLEQRINIFDAAVLVHMKFQVINIFYLICDDSERNEQIVSPSRLIDHYQIALYLTWLERKRLKFHFDYVIKL